MARFSVNTPVESADPVVSVDHDSAAPLVPGRHRFALEVIDEGDDLRPPGRGAAADYSAPRRIGARM